MFTTTTPAGLSAGSTGAATLHLSMTMNDRAVQLYAAAHDLTVDQLDADDREAATEKLGPILDQIATGDLDDYFDSVASIVNDGSAVR